MKVPPLHPLPGHKLHKLAKARDRYRPTARNLECWVVEAKIAVVFERVADRIAAGFVASAKQYQRARNDFFASFFHGRKPIAVDPADSVRPEAQ
jgi:hypothetical protein